MKASITGGPTETGQLQSSWLDNPEASSHSQVFICLLGHSRTLLRRPIVMPCGSSTLEGSLERAKKLSMRSTKHSFQDPLFVERHKRTKIWGSKTSLKPLVIPSCLECDFVLSAVLKTTRLGWKSHGFWEFTRKWLSVSYAWHTPSRSMFSFRPVLGAQ